MPDNDPDNAFRNKLDLIIAEQVKTNLMLSNMVGEHNLLKQVVDYQAERLKEFKVENLKDIDRLYGKCEVHEEKINELNRWKFYILGIMIACGVAFQVGLAFIKSWFK